VLPDVAIDVLFLVMPALPVLYLVLQITAILKLRGWLRAVASICGAAMLALVLFVGWASGVMGSNIAPIYIVLALPLFTVVLILLWLVHVMRPRRPDTRYL
jgi:Ca2+/Na+ antiporter